MFHVHFIRAYHQAFHEWPDLLGTSRQQAPDGYYGGCLAHSDKCAITSLELGLHRTLSDIVKTPQRIDECNLGETQGAVRSLKVVTNAKGVPATSTGSE